MWGKEDAPQQGGLPEAKHRVSPTQAEVASDATTLIRNRGRILCGVPANQSQKVTLPSLKFEQAVTYPDGPSPATGEGDGVGADAPAATLGAYLCAVRTMLLHRSYPALQATERGSSRGNLSPLTVFWFLLYAQKERHGGEPYGPSPSGDSATPKATPNHLQSIIMFPAIFLLKNPYPI